MKKSSVILCAALAVALCAPVYAADNVAPPMPQKTAIKTVPTARCTTLASKGSKECAQTADTRSIRH
jgi:opacity protein-like surface antigen